MKQTFIDFFGILFVLLFCSFTLIALVLHGYYNPFIDAMSELGAGKGAIYFNIGMISSGYVGTIMLYERYKWFSILLTISGVITTIALSFVGWFPMPTDLHGVFSGIMFTSMTIFFILYFILTKSRFVIAMLLIFIIFAFINIPLTKWIIFITINGWIGITSTKFYYRKKKRINKVQNI